MSIEQLLDEDPLRNEIFNFYTNLQRASAPAAGFRKDDMLRTLQALNVVYQQIVPAVRQALTFTKGDARDEVQAALNGLIDGSASSAQAILSGWNRVITASTSSLLIAPSFTADMVTLAKRLERAHMEVLLVNNEVPAWYRNTYKAIQDAIRAASAIASSVWNNFTDTLGLVYLALKLAAGAAVGYVAYTYTRNYFEHGAFKALKQTSNHLRAQLPAASNDSEDNE